MALLNQMHMAMESSCISKYSDQECPKKSSPPPNTQYLTKTNENDDNDDDYKFF